MGRLPKIILMIVGLTALFLLITNAFSSCSKASDLGDDTIELANDASDDLDDLFDDSDDIFEDDSDEIFEDDIDYADDDNFVEGDEADNTDFSYTEPDYTEPAPAAKSSYNSSGNYMVIAGNYLVESNARTMIDKLGNLGYPDSDIGIFDRSQYHTVIAYRSSNYSSALEVSNAIKRQGIDCYVKKRQY